MHFAKDETMSNYRLALLTLLAMLLAGCASNTVPDPDPSATAAGADEYGADVVFGHGRATSPVGSSFDDGVTLTANTATLPALTQCPPPAALRIRPIGPGRSSSVWRCVKNA